MNDHEIYQFIDTMEDMGDEWEFEDVKRVYGDMSLKEALSDRIVSVKMFYSILSTTIAYTGGEKSK